MRRAGAALAMVAALVAAGPGAAAPAASTAPAAQPQGRSATLGGGLTTRLDGARLVISARALEGEDWDALAARALQDPAKGPALEAASSSGGARATLRAGQDVELPLRLWPPGLGARALLALFPGDRLAEDGWHHLVTPGATAWSLALLFTGSGARHPELRAENGGPATVRAGAMVVIPRAALRPELTETGVARTSAAPASSSAPAPPKAAGQRAAPEQASERAAGQGNASDASAAAGLVIRGGGGLAREATGTLEMLRDAARALSAAAAAAATSESEEPQPSGPSGPSGPAASNGPESSAPELPETEDEGPESPPPSPALQEASTLLEECAPIDVEPGPAAEPGQPPGQAPAEQTEPAAQEEPEEPFTLRPGLRSADGALTFASDAQGPHAVYRLRRGETLYSDVVLRFTGLLSGRDVNAAAARFAARSGITDVTNIAVGTAIRIPLADLVPEYLPPGHPRRQRWEEEQAESSRLARRERRRNLAGVHVLLDAGHGGNDPGAGTGLVWEDDHAYDIACRVMAVLADRTQATVHPLIRDRSSGHAPLARLRRDTDEELLTSPPVRLANVSTRVAVNMRWVLANDMERRLRASGVGDDRIVFLSLHADSLHESATGTMAYFAAARLRTSSRGVPRDGAHATVAETREENGFTMTRRQALRSEGLSRDLGDALIASIRSKGLPVQGYTPVRGCIERGGLMVPAVLKYNRVPSAVLLEAGNLNNPRDQKSIRDPVFRQDFADAIVAGLVTYFEGHDSGSRKAGGR